PRHIIKNFNKNEYLTPDKDGSLHEISMEMTMPHLNYNGILHIQAPPCRTDQDDSPKTPTNEYDEHIEHDEHQEAPIDKGQYSSMDHNVLITNLLDQLALSQDITTT
ncbi:hypothetical protein KI387_036884, partial [Taxus chinensis]